MKGNIGTPNDCASGGTDERDRGGFGKEVCKTSLSDNGSFPEYCFHAAHDEEIYKNFKRSDAYRLVLEHVNRKQGEEYLREITKNLTLSNSEWESIIKNDSIGNPIVEYYDLFPLNVSISPTTLRYVKVLSDMINMFDIERIKSVAEIGVGYGGQCRIIMSKLNLHKYTLFDLPEVLELAKKFLQDLGLVEKIDYIDMEHVYKNEYDFCISNYAFSELRRQMQDIYLDNVVFHSHSGYITWNCLSQEMLDGYSVKELLEMIPNSRVFPEVPLTHPKNCIIVWGERII